LNDDIRSGGGSSGDSSGGDSARAAPAAFGGLAYVLRVQAMIIVGTLSALTMPVWWAAVSHVRGWDIVAFGTMNTANAAMGFVVGTWLTIYLKRLDRRQVLVACGLIMMAVELATSVVTQLPLFFALRALNAAAVGTVTVLGMVYLGFTPNPAKSYGWYSTFQALTQAVGLFVVPQLAARLGFNGLQWTLAGGGALVALLAARLPRYAPSAAPAAGSDAAATPAPAVPPIPWAAAVPAVLCTIAFSFYTTDFFGYSERFGNARGIDAQTIGTILAVTTAVGVPASLFVSWLGDRLGLLLPISAASVAGAAAALLLLFPQFGLAGYWVAMSVFSIVWSFMLPYLLALTARVDPVGRLLVATQPLRAAVSAGLAGVVTMATAWAGLAAVAWMAAAAVLLCPLLALLALKLKARTAADRPALPAASAA